MGELSIGDVAKDAGIASSAIRYYERKGLIPLADRRSGRRVYDEHIFERLAIIEHAKGAGFTIAEIKQLMSGFTTKTSPGERWRRLAESKLTQLDERIAEAQRMQTVLRMVMQCQCPTLDDCARALRSAEQKSQECTRGR